jgi:hypothetical protein
MGTNPAAPNQPRNPLALLATRPAGSQERPVVDALPQNWGGFQRGTRGRSFLSLAVTLMNLPVSSRTLPRLMMPGNWALIRNQHWLDQGSLILFTRWNTTMDMQIASVFSQERQWETGDIT